VEDFFCRDSSPIVSLKRLPPLASVSFRPRAVWSKLSRLPPSDHLPLLVFRDPSFANPFAGYTPLLRGQVFGSPPPIFCLFSLLEDVSETAGFKHGCPTIIPFFPSSSPPRPSMSPVFYKQSLKVSLALLPFPLTCPPFSSMEA